MFPRFPIDNAVNGGVAHAKRNGDGTIAHAPGLAPDFADSRITKNRVACPFATNVPIFLAHIPQIIGSGAEKHMVWIYAISYVTTVTDFHAVWHLAFPSLNSNTMRI